MAEAVKVLAPAHQSMIWIRQRQTNQLSSTLREFYPAALQAFDELAGRDAPLRVLAIAPTPAAGRKLSRSPLRCGAVAANAASRTGPLRSSLRCVASSCKPPAVAAEAMGATVAALVVVIAELQKQIDRLETELADHFEQHPDARIIRSLPGLGTILGSRVLAEFGDDPNRYADAKPPRTTRYVADHQGVGTATSSAGPLRRNRRLADACYLWAFAAITASPGARAYYDQRRTAGDTHHRALRALASRLVGILHGCLRHQTRYDEHTAGAHRTAAA